MIPYGKQDISNEDIDAVIDVLRSEFLTQGPVVPEFENAVAGKVKAKYGVALNSATSALHVACLALGVGEGDWVWTSSNSFVASANCALYCGANVSFVDINSRTYNIDTVKLEEKLIQARFKGVLPKVVIPVHFAGQSCDMKRIRELSNEFGFKVIEDASHAIGAEYLGKPVGGCEFSDITVFSFHPVKIITTAEGGLATTNDKFLANEMSLLRSHGISRDNKVIGPEVDGPWHYKQLKLGFNYRMTDLQAALGLSQLKKLEDFIGKRREIAKYYNKHLIDTDWVIPHQEDYQKSSYHLYVIKLPVDLIKQKKSVYETLINQGIGVNVHYIPIHTQPYYTGLGIEHGDLSATIEFYERALTIPIFPSLSQADQELIVERLKGLEGWL
ncbi:UDP-4-amino-4,6-dideoxy-N-acetyl-beta-L-altrosamine transaminase [Alphaproteobacteria bacterium]|nr:UDP-4-amino-4,6-dideoxy-N-acetyl-beta-L-altrosamine transaminase [Alphaproteobacteria bacterium]